eukprot:TRINITY_DN1083_c0_g1_i1.p1 TRINITY_DN1083_c0_g1~~TRINITY_DN1083_c0_g1_i1.p1  ORF type:complete len:137 (-),score=14.35 TRINITY_DN1083_c0_g1_i1:122-484(-)
MGGDHHHDHHHDSKLSRFLENFHKWEKVAQPGDIVALSHPHHSGYSAMLDRAWATGRPIIRNKLLAHVYSWAIFPPGVFLLYGALDPYHMFPRIFGIRGGGPYFEPGRNTATKKRLGLSD